MTTTTALAINIPLVVLFFAVWTGIPLWLVFKHPDEKPAPVRPVPQPRRQPGRVSAGTPSPAWNVDRLRLTSR